MNPRDMRGTLTALAGGVLAAVVIYLTLLYVLLLGNGRPLVPQTWQQDLDARYPAGWSLHCTTRAAEDGARLCLEGP